MGLAAPALTQARVHSWMPFSAASSPLSAHALFAAVYALPSYSSRAVLRSRLYSPFCCFVKDCWVWSGASSHWSLPWEEERDAELGTKCTGLQGDRAGSLAAALLFKRMLWILLHPGDPSTTGGCPAHLDAAFSYSTGQNERERGADSVWSNYLLFPSMSNNFQQCIFLRNEKEIVVMRLN